MRPIQKVQRQPMVLVLKPEMMGESKGPKTVAYVKFVSEPVLEGLFGC